MFRYKFKKVQEFKLSAGQIYDLGKKTKERDAYLEKTMHGPSGPPY